MNPHQLPRECEHLSQSKQKSDLSGNQEVYILTLNLSLKPETESEVLQID